MSINGGLYQGGPGSLFIAYTFYSCMLALVNNCIAEMTVYQPVSGGFIRLAGKYVDEALGFVAGWNFFFYGKEIHSFVTSETASLVGRSKCFAMVFWKIEPHSTPLSPFLFIHEL